MIDDAFDDLGVHRLEAPASAKNSRVNGVVMEVRAIQEAVRPRTYLESGKYVDQFLASLVNDDWRRSKAVWGPKFH